MAETEEEGTHPGAARSEEVGFGQRAYARRLVQVDGHAAVVRHLDPALGQHLEVVAPHLLQHDLLLLFVRRPQAPA